MSCVVLDLRGKTALVTGGAKGIGLAVTRALVGAGAAVIACGRDAQALRLAENQTGCTGFACDVANEADVRSLFSRWTGGGLDILVNNAGLGIFKPLLETTVEEWDRVLAVNLRGAFLCGREALRAMIAGGRGGRIVNIASVVGLKGYPNQGAYTASKHGLLGLTKVLAVEGQEHNVIAQAICPGGVDTEMVAASRPDLDRSILMSPDEVADAVLFCLAQTGNAITDLIPLRRRNGAPFA